MGKPPDSPQISLPVEHRGYEKLAFAEVIHPGSGDRVFISTVILGGGMSMDGRPFITFETRIFGGPYDQKFWRYGSRAEAMARHDEAVKMVNEVVQVATPPSDTTRDE